MQINCCLFGELVYFVASKNSLQYFLWMIWSRNLQQEKRECIFYWSCATYVWRGNRDNFVVTVFVDIMVELAFFNSTNISTKIETAMIAGQCCQMWYRTTIQGILVRRSYLNPNQLGALTKTCIFKKPNTNVTIGHKKWPTNILQQKCIFSCLTIFLDENLTEKKKGQCV